MTVRFIDISSEDIDYLSREKEEHRLLVQEEVLKNSDKFAEEYRIELTSLPESAMIKVRLPVKKEHRLAYGFPPFDQRRQGQGVGQSSLPQEGDEGEGGQEDKKGKEKNDGSSPVQPKEEKQQRQTLKRGQEVSRLQKIQKSRGAGQDMSGEEDMDDIQDNEDGKKAGTQPGEDTFETEISIEELRDAASKELKLPELKEKNLQALRVKRLRRPYGYRRKGPAGQLSDVRTAKERLKRVAAGEKEIDSSEEAPFNPQDLRYRRKEEDLEYLSDAVIFLIRDVSGSIDDNKRKIMRMIAMHIARSIRKVHQRVKIVFITHHTEARERDEWRFFHLKSSGGTKISSGSDKALEIIAKSYPPELWNIFVCASTDGENEHNDMERMRQSFGKLCEIATLFAYFEILSSQSLEKEIFPLQGKYDNFVPCFVPRAELAGEAFNKLLEAAEKRRRNEGE